MPPKRKAKEVESDPTAEQPRRSQRRKLAVDAASQNDEVKTKKSKPNAVTKVKTSKNARSEAISAAAEPEAQDVEEKDLTEDPPVVHAKPLNTFPKINNGSALAGRQYWLMKAEPESRTEKGHDIKFSIDDLAAKTDPEPWDGIRAYPARNNLRSMKKGDLAFFYHSSCKVPAIVGTMEVVEEHSPDLSAHNPKAPYYDPKSTPEDPKWSVVHVTFKQKLKTPITLKELKAWQTTKGHPLENMQMLKLARLSVSKVSKEEWRFLVNEMEKNGDVIQE